MGNKDDLGRLIRFYRLSRNMTQAELAESIGQSPSSVAMYELGQREPDMDVIECIADILNIRIRDLIPERGESKTVATPEDFARLEALHQNPALGILFDRASKMSKKDIDFILRITENISKEVNDD